MTVTLTGAWATIGAGGTNPVAIDGSAVIFIPAATAGTKFAKITNITQNVADALVTVSDTTTITNGNWAIGGKRATISNADSLLLFGASGAKAGWTIQVEDATAAAISGTLISVTTGGDTTSGALVIQGNSPTTRVVMTQSANNSHFGVNTAGAVIFRNLDIRNSFVGSKSAANFITNQTTTKVFIQNCILGHATDSMRSVAIRTAGSPYVVIDDCEIKSCTVASVAGLECGNSTTMIVRGSWIHDNSIGVGILAVANPLRITDSIIEGNTGDGINCASTVVGMLIAGCTINGNGGDGIDFSTAATGDLMILRNNQITNNVGNGFSGVAAINALLAINDGNNYFGNGAARVNLTAGANDKAVNPGYVDAAGNNFAVTNSLVLGVGVPVGGSRKVGAGQSNTYTYIDLGAAQDNPATSELGTTSLIARSVGQEITDNASLFKRGHS
jgi:hypothetical protein